MDSTAGIVVWRSLKCVNDLLDSNAEKEYCLPVGEAENLAKPAEVMGKPATPMRPIREKGASQN